MLKIILALKLKRMEAWECVLAICGPMLPSTLPYSRTGFSLNYNRIAEIDEVRNRLAISGTHDN